MRLNISPLPQLPSPCFDIYNVIILVNNGYLRDIVGPSTTQLSSQNFGLHFEFVCHGFGPAVYGRGGVGPITTHLSSQNFYLQLSQATSIIVFVGN